MMNKLKIKQFLFTFTGTILALTACKKDKLPQIDPQPTSTAGVYVLCEGSFSGGGKSSISYYDIATANVEADYFKKQNGTELGNNASDLKQYGSKMYCVINGTSVAAKDSYLEVISIATGKSVKRIPFFDANKGFMPKAIAFYKNKAYVSGYDGYVSKIDTASLTIESRLAVGGALEGLAIVNGKLYVSNSDHPYYPNANNASVSVVDLSGFTKLKDIPVGYNPTKIGATNAGDLYVVTRGNYGDIAASFDKLSSVTDTKTGTSALDVEYLKVTGNRGFVIGPYGNEYLKTINLATGALAADFITDGTAVVLPYGVTVDPLSNDVFVADANDYGPTGKTFCFSAEGKRRFEFVTGASPQAAVFRYNYK